MLTSLPIPKTILCVVASLRQCERPGFGPLWQKLRDPGLIFALTGAPVTAGYGAASGWRGGRVAVCLATLNKVAAAMFRGLALRLVA